MDIERTPLIQRDSDETIEESAVFGLAVFLAEAKTLVTLAWPVIISYLLAFTLNIAPVFSLGHVGTKELAAIALATMLCNVTGFSVGMGMASALDTLCSQSHTGSADKHALGKHLQRSIVVMFLLAIPISALWMCTEPILLLVGQDAEVSRLAGIFTMWLTPGLFPYLVADCLKRYLQAQGIMKPAMYITMIASPVNMFLQWLLVWSPYGVGSVGAPLATTITNFLIPILTILYVAYVDGGAAYGGWVWKEALDMQQILIFVKLGIPGVLMLCSEWWAYEVVALAAGVLGDTTLAAQSVIINTASLFFMNSIGAAIATT
jgi:multidrug resistance protein, MATE family